MLKNKPALRLAIIIAVALIAIVYISYHIFNAVKPALTLNAARYETFTKSESINGYIFKDDELIVSPYAGYVEYLFKDGERLSAKSVIANVYPNATSQQYEFLMYLNDVIDILETCRINSNVALSEITDKISVQQKLINEKSSEGDADWIVKNQAELERLQSIKSVILDGKTDMSSELALYKNQREIQISTMGACYPITTEESGYFFRYFDGYEGQLTTDKSGSSPSAFEQYESSISKSVSVNAIGSIVRNISWYYECLVDIDKSEKYIQDSYYNITFEGKDKPIRMHLSKKSVDRQKGKAVLTFSSSVINSEFDMNRMCGASVVTESATGLKIKIEDVYIVDGVSCVYIFNEGVASLREINIIFEMGGYYLVDRNTTGKYKILNLNDLVITNQSNLYDGKVVG
ncbi:MAG: hypothetical protein K6F14_07640 [Clostridiales bacterium]|nr:hypothetical protein [Clostridiales bacterium]